VDHEVKQTAAAARWPVYLALGLLVVFGVIFLVEFISASENSVGKAAEELTSETYMDVVASLLENADPENGAMLIAQYDCAACHRAGVVNHIAPSFVGLAVRAEQARPPLTAAAYIYESIVYPQAHMAGDYSTVMPQNYGARLSESELGDMIAYLLTPDAE
jgi:cytochrome c551/c552